MFPDWGDGRPLPKVLSSPSLTAHRGLSEEADGEDEPSLSKGSHATAMHHTMTLRHDTVNGDNNHNHNHEQDDAAMYLGGAHHVWGSPGLSFSTSLPTKTETFSSSLPPPSHLEPAIPDDTSRPTEPSSVVHSSLDTASGDHPTRTSSFSESHQDAIVMSHFGDENQDSNDTTSWDTGHATVPFFTQQTDSRLDDWHPELDFHSRPTQLFSAEVSPSSSAGEGWQVDSLPHHHSSHMTYSVDESSSSYPPYAYHDARSDHEDDFGDFVHGVDCHADALATMSLSQEPIKPLPPPPVFSASLPSKRQPPRSSKPFTLMPSVSMKPILPLYVAPLPTMAIDEATLPPIFAPATDSTLPTASQARPISSPALSETLNGTQAPVKDKDAKLDTRSAEDTKASLLFILEAMAKKKESAPIKEKPIAVMKESAPGKEASASVNEEPASVNEEPASRVQSNQINKKTSTLPSTPPSTFMSLLKPKPAPARPFSSSEPLARNTGLDDFDPLKSPPPPSPPPLSSSTSSSHSPSPPISLQAAAPIQNPTPTRPSSKTETSMPEDDFGDWVTASPFKSK